MHDTLTTNCVLETFQEEITARGGTVTDTFNDGRRLFVKSTLPLTGDVKPRDRLKGGVALKATGGQIVVHPFVFRLVCSNGAIMARTVSSRPVSCSFDFDPRNVIEELRQTISCCCEPEVFTKSVSEIRSSQDRDADLAIMMLPFVERFNSSLVQQILQRFFRDGDESRFGLMNAVTSVARDTKDAETRWNLEELGGGIPIAVPTSMPKRPAHTRRRELELVG